MPNVDYNEVAGRNGITGALPLERRLHQRYPTGLRAQLVCGDQLHAVTIVDLSMGGAKLSTSRREWNKQRVTLFCSGISEARPLTGQVVSTGWWRCHIAFDLDEDVRRLLRNFLMENAGNRD